MKIINLILIFFWIFSFNLVLPFTQNPEPGGIGQGGRNDKSYLNINSDLLKKGEIALKQALKFEKKNKFKKAEKRFNDALKYFLSAYQDNPNNIVILNNLGFIYNKIDDLIMAEIYYQEGLKIDPKDISINQRLGELYLNTRREDLAKKRLKMLSSCNCKEYLYLKNMIEKN